jgi:subtilisin family serine protease
LLLAGVGLLHVVHRTRQPPGFLLLAVSLLAGAAALGASTVRGGAADTAAATATLVQLTGRPDRAERAILADAGARLVDARLRLWRLSGDGSRRAVAALRARDGLAFTQQERTYTAAAVTADYADPLVGAQWWRAVVGVAGLAAPGPGVPVALVDSGVSFGHEEFAGRPNLEALNPQEPSPIGGIHGTAVASVVGAPVNGVGVVGIYPEAVVRSFDAAIGDGRRLESSEIVEGILAAARAGTSVINLSLGAESKDAAIETAVGEAVRLGSLVVAASGNSGDVGNPLTYPAVLPHVLTVAATDLTGQVAFFSSQSVYVDLAAPGVDIPVASAADGGYTTSSGTSFSAPIVSGAAAWLWTVRPELDAGQVAEILRRSARDVGATGVDAATGYGILDLPAALAYPAPAADPGEPNDDTSQVRSRAGTLTTRTRQAATVTATVTAYEDPRDVLRVWIPAGKTLTATATTSGGQDVALSLFRDASTTVVGQAARYDRVLRATATGTGSRLAFRNVKRGRWMFLVVVPAKGVRSAVYTLRTAVR